MERPDIEKWERNGINYVIKDDYIYTYNPLRDSGWHVNVLDRKQPEYCPIESEFDGIPVTNLDHTFDGCLMLTTAPEIPITVTNMNWSFAYCIRLIDAPAIPKSVTDMYGTFIDCTSLTTKPVISATITPESNTFLGCRQFGD